jgi:integrase
MPRPRTGYVERKPSGLWGYRYWRPDAHPKSGKAPWLCWEAVGYEAQGTTRADAERELRYRVVDIERGIWQPPLEPDEPEPAQTLHEYSQRWLARIEHQVGRGQMAKATLTGYTEDVRRLGKLRALPLDEVTLPAVKRWRDGAADQWSPGTVNLAITRLAQLLDEAKEDGLLATNPLRGARRLKLRNGHTTRTWLPPTDVERLLDAVPEARRRQAKGRKSEHPRSMRRAFIGVLALAGLRVGEAAALLWGDVDLAAGKLRVREGKTAAATRTVLIGPMLRELLAEHRPLDAKPDALLFATVHGTPVRSSWAGQVIKAACRAAGLAEVGPHALRRSYISAEAYRDALSVRRLMRQVGHTSPSMTLGVYAQVEDEGDDAAQVAAAERLLGDSEAEGIAHRVGRTARNRA